MSIYYVTMTIERMTGDLSFPLFVAVYSLHRKECRNIKRIGRGSCRALTGKDKRGDSDLCRKKRK